MGTVAPACRGSCTTTLTGSGESFAVPMPSFCAAHTHAVVVQATDDHPDAQAKAVDTRQRARSRTSKDAPAAATIRESWRPPLPYETVKSGTDR